MPSPEAGLSLGGCAVTASIARHFTGALGATRATAQMALGRLPALDRRGVLDLGQRGDHGAYGPVRRAQRLGVDP